MNTPCQLLEWDTQFFHQRIARVLGRRLDESTATAVRDWCGSEQIDCLYFLADADHPETIALAEAHGFNLTDVRITYCKRMPAGELATTDAPDGATLRPARLEDLPILESISRDSFVDSRFYFDQRFSRSAVSQMYQVWVRQSISGQTDHVLVLDYAGRAAGYIICRLIGDGQGQVPLVCVDAERRGQGLGRYLYTGGLRWFAHKGVDKIYYVTQARNIRAQRLIQQLGFLTDSVELWYHKWFDRLAIEQARARAG
jgi:dTDP-4-amino-4,6-dideoxy-D-galactose acyltransferase